MQFKWFLSVDLNISWTIKEENHMQSVTFLWWLDWYSKNMNITKKSTFSYTEVVCVCCVYGFIKNKISFGFWWCNCPKYLVMFKWKRYFLYLLPRQHHHHHAYVRVYLVIWFRKMINMFQPKYVIDKVLLHQMGKKTNNQKLIQFDVVAIKLLIPVLRLFISFHVWLLCMLACYSVLVIITFCSDHD